jgi:ATP-binding cassette, subfamily B, bacterial
MVAGDLLALLAQVLVPLLIEQAIDGPISHHDEAALWHYIGLMLILGLVQTAMYVLRRWPMTAALNVETDLRVDLFRRLQALPATFHDSYPSGQLVSRMSMDLTAVRRFIGTTLIFLISNTMTLVVTVVLLLRIQLALGLFVLVALLPMVLATASMSRRYGRQVRDAQDMAGNLATTVEETALGVRDVKSYGRRRWVNRLFTADARGVWNAEIAKVGTRSALLTTVASYPWLLLAVMLIGGIEAVAHHAMTLGAFVAFTTFYIRLVYPVTAMGTLLSATQEAASATGRIFEILDLTPSVTDPAAPRRLPASARSRVRLDDVHFRYPEAPTDILRGACLDIPAGQTTALVGAVGSGKTTLTALIARLADTTAGRITIDGVDIRDIRLRELRSTVAMVFGEAMLFSGTVRENLTLGRTGIGKRDLAMAIQVAQADFVYQLPQRLETRLGEQGLSLSGGQRQRLALARALVDHPRVLILDDPLSALDVHTEHLVEQALRRVLQTTTSLVVAHRPSTVLLADQVAVLADGRIADVGPHAELLARSPLYRDLVGSFAPRGAANA